MTPNATQNAPATQRPRLYLSQEPASGLDRLSALEFGAIDDGQGADRWVGIGDHVGLLHDEPGGRCVGFIVQRASSYDPDHPDNASLWEAPRFDVPALGLTDVAPNAVIVATWALFGRGPTLNRQLFSQAIHADGEVALRRWLRCLQAGDSMAHYALGYTLYELGRHPEAYRHLRHYCEIAPQEAWAWCWLGKAAQAIGEMDEAAAAYTRALELEDDDDPTDAHELIERLWAPAPEDSPPPAETDAGSAPPQAGWLRALLHVAESAGCGYTLWSDATSAMLAFDTAPQTAWLDVESVTGEVRVRALVGNTPDEDFDAEEVLEAIDADATDLAAEDDGDVWLLAAAPVLLDELDGRTLQLLLAGVAATAAAYRANANLRGLDLGAPPPYAETSGEDAEEPSLDERILSAGSEDGLFRLALDVGEDPDLDGASRERAFRRIAAAIDALRATRGLGPDASMDELEAHWDGPPPAPVDAVQADLPPGATARASTYVEMVAGRLRVIPTVTIELADGSTSELVPTRLHKRGPEL